MMNFRDEAVVPLSAVLLSEGQALHYEYDFGDGWGADSAGENYILRS
ncbi:hypothetical protein [Marinobacter sp.]